ncbi:hypothetical protein J8L98_24580, partial [Pseudoalteromonas sp. MMG013]|uniref:hypothetical protein n=1 Tax=Pseudoalteromonas sp. MMG013 TaxID=2822687 RepID=UPI001B37F692
MSSILFISYLMLSGIHENNVARLCWDSRVEMSNGDIATSFVLNDKSHLLITYRHPYSKDFVSDGVEYSVFDEKIINELHYWVGFTRDGDS